MKTSYRWNVNGETWLCKVDNEDYPNYASMDFFRIEHPQRKIFKRPLLPTFHAFEKITVLMHDYSSGEDAAFQTLQKFLIENAREKHLIERCNNFWGA